MTGPRNGPFLVATDISLEIQEVIGLQNRWHANKRQNDRQKYDTAIVG